MLKRVSRRSKQIPAAEESGAEQQRPVVSDDGAKCLGWEAFLQIWSCIMHMPREQLGLITTPGLKRLGVILTFSATNWGFIFAFLAFIAASMAVNLRLCLPSHNIVEKSSSRAPQRKLRQVAAHARQTGRGGKPSFRSIEA